MLRAALLLVCLSVLSACGTVNNAMVEKTKQYEYYRVFDIKTDADRSVVANAASNGLGKNMGSAREAMPIPSYSEPPAKPGRFKVVKPGEGSQLGSTLSAFAALAGGTGGGSLGLKSAKCDGAVWTANGSKHVKNRFNLNLSACIFEYQDGYHLDMYAHFTKKEGGLMQMSRAMANAMVGTPEEWTEKAFLDVARGIHKETGADITFLEGYPKVNGTPWLDKGENFAKR